MTAGDAALHDESIAFLMENRARKATWPDLIELQPPHDQPCNVLRDDPW